MQANDQNKLTILLKQPRKLFHTKDLELLWGIQNKNTLYSTISRYLKKGILLQIYKGFYSIIELKAISDYALGYSAIHNYCYLSTESILAKNGLIFQAVPIVTFCGSTTKRIQIMNRSFLCRKLNDNYLYNTAGIIDHEDYKEATTERAIADMLHFNKQYYFDVHERIDWKKVKVMQKTVGYL